MEPGKMRRRLWAKRLDKLARRLSYLSFNKSMVLCICPSCHKQLDQGAINRDSETVRMACPHCHTLSMGKYRDLLKASRDLLKEYGHV